MTETAREHWDQAYAGKPATRASRRQSDPLLSLSVISAAGVAADDAIADIGGGASNLIDRLLCEGWHRLSVLDVSSEALGVAKRRLGERPQAVTRLVEDITSWLPPQDTFSLWHDRAVFHFLVEENDRSAYLRALRLGLRSDSHVVLATFALTGPERCSGLPVRRYSPATLQDVLGAGFKLARAQPETHLTPAGATQDFNWRLFRKTGGGEQA